MTHPHPGKPRGGSRSEAWTGGRSCTPSWPPRATQAHLCGKRFGHPQSGQERLTGSRPLSRKPSPHGPSRGPGPHPGPGRASQSRPEALRTPILQSLLSPAGSDPLPRALLPSCTSDATCSLESRNGRGARCGRERHTSTGASPAR